MKRLTAILLLICAFIGTVSASSMPPVPTNQTTIKVYMTFEV